MHVSVPCIEYNALSMASKVVAFCLDGMVGSPSSGVSPHNTYRLTYLANYYSSTSVQSYFKVAINSDICSFSLSYHRYK